MTGFDKSAEVGWPGGEFVPRCVMTPGALFHLYLPSPGRFCIWPIVGWRLSQAELGQA